MITSFFNSYSKGCACNSFGSKGLNCDDSGTCSCKENFEGLKCDKCMPQRYNYPLCEECTCDVKGVPDDFFTIGGCEIPAQEGKLCSCKENVEGRICDTCKPLFWNLQKSNALGCDDCGCHLPGMYCLFFDKLRISKNYNKHQN